MSELVGINEMEWLKRAVVEVWYLERFGVGQHPAHHDKWVERFEEGVEYAAVNMDLESMRTWDSVLDKFEEMLNKGMLTKFNFKKWKMSKDTVSKDFNEIAEVYEESNRDVSDEATSPEVFESD